MSTEGAAAAFAVSKLGALLGGSLLGAAIIAAVDPPKSRKELFLQAVCAGIGGVGGASNALTLYLFYSSDGTNLSNVTPGSFTANAGQWFHIACTRSSNSVRFFVDGTQLGSTQTVSATFHAGSGAWRCYTWAGGTSVVNANLDDLRITVGQSRYTSNFTPPTAAHPDS